MIEASKRKERVMENIEELFWLYTNASEEVKSQIESILRSSIPSSESPDLPSDTV